MISILAWIVVVSAVVLLAYVIWRDHLSRRNSGALLWFAPVKSNSLTTLAAFFVAIAAWHVASDLVGNPTILPAPATSLQALWEMATWQLLLSVLITLRRIAIAFTIASVVGVGLGLAAGLFPWIGRLVLPLNSAIRYVPPTAFIGLCIVWFGIFEGSKLALIILGVLFYIVQMTVDVARSFPRGLGEASLNLGATDWETFRRVIFPYCLPDLLAVLRVNIGAAWIFVVVAELVSAQDGIGHMLAVSQRFLATPRLFALLFLVGMLGFITDSAFATAIRVSSPWKK